MGKAIVTEKGTLKFYVSNPNDNMIQNPSFTIISQPDQNVKIDGSGVYAGVFQVMLTASQYNGGNQTAPVTFAIQAQCKSKTELGALLLVETESTPMPVMYQVGQSVVTANVKCSFTEAGQDTCLDE